LAINLLHFCDFNDLRVGAKSRKLGLDLFWLLMDDGRASDNESNGVGVNMSFFKGVKTKVERFSEVAGNLPDSERRKAEEAHLKPAPIEPYDGPQPRHKSELESRTALIVFRDKQQQELIGELFSIRESVKGETYITDISLLEYIANQVKLGFMYVTSNNQIHFVEGEIADHSNNQESENKKVNKRKRLKIPTR
jgi:hypothetical protein